MKATYVDHLLVLALALAACRTDSTGASMQASLREADDSPQFSDWSAAVNLGPVVNSAAQDIEVSISKDGLSLYIASNRSGSSHGRYSDWKRAAPYPTTAHAASAGAMTDDPQKGSIL